MMRRIDEDLKRLGTLAGVTRRQPVFEAPGQARDMASLTSNVLSYLAQHKGQFGTDPAYQKLYSAVNGMTGQVRQQQAMAQQAQAQPSAPPPPIAQPAPDQGQPQPQAQPAPPYNSNSNTPG